VPLDGKRDTDTQNIAPIEITVSVRIRGRTYGDTAFADVTGSIAAGGSFHQAADLSQQKRSSLVRRGSESTLCDGVCRGREFFPTAFGKKSRTFGPNRICKTRLAPAVSNQWFVGDNGEPR
jgi:hypothetical protein